MSSVGEWRTPKISERKITAEFSSSLRTDLSNIAAYLQCAKLKLFRLIEGADVSEQVMTSVVTREKFEIQAPDGVMDCYSFYPPDAGPCPAVIFFMDGFGVREDLFLMAEKLAAKKYYVIMPNLYYRAGVMSSIDIATAFTPGPEQARVMELMQSLENTMVVKDTASVIAFLQKQAQVDGSAMGVVGYCMGGAFALMAAGSFPERIVAAASIHGARLATDQVDSPHLLAGRMSAALYIALAKTDPWFSEAERHTLKEALDREKINLKMVTFPAQHGFAVNGTPAFDKRAAEQHWLDISFLFRKAFGRK
jgi:carboxymethylenebutenolidase